MVNNKDSWQDTSPVITAVRATGTGPTLPQGHLSYVLLVLAGVLSALVPAGGLASASASNTSRPPANDGASLLVTPLLSPARVPLALQDFQARGQVLGRLAGALSPQAIGASAAAQSCALVSQGGRVIFADHPERPVMPASNMKLLTATAALDRLGPAYRYYTQVKATGPFADGVVHGDLYLVGGGDPLLRLPSYPATIVGGDPVFTNFDNLVQAVKAAGVRRVTGSVVGDGSRYDAQRSVPSWPARYAAEGDIGELSALGVDDGFALAGPPVPVSAPPAEQAAGLLAHMLDKAGVVVTGPSRTGTTPPGAKELAEVTSPPLVQELGEALRESDNTAMELVTKELGHKVTGTGSTVAGTAAIRADLAADGLSTKGLVNLDGSGLSPRDRVTCDLLAGVLEHAGPHSDLVKDLPVAARSGTLADEMGGTPAAGRVWAKTGTLDHVKALSGWVQASAGQGDGNPLLSQPVVFAEVLNGLPLTFTAPGVSADSLADRLAVDLAEFPQAPPLTDYETVGSS